MSEAAKNIDQDDIESAQIKAAIDGSAETGEILDIRKIEDTLRGKLDKAGDIFTKDDKDRWNAKISEAAAASDSQAIWQINSQIESEKREIANVTKDYKTEIEKNKDFFRKTDKIDSAKDYIDQFMQQQFPEKQRWMQELKKDISERLTIYAEIVRLDPAMKEQIQGLGRTEGLKKLEALKDKKLLPHDKMMAEFKAFPKEYQNEVPDFKKLPLEKKKVEIDKLHDKLNKAYEDKIAKAEGIFSKEEIKEAKDYFKIAPLSGSFGKVKCLETLESNLKLVQETAEDFEKLQKDLPQSHADMSKNYKDEFYKARYEGHRGKKEILEDLKVEIEVMDKRETTKYKDLLTKHLTEKNIRESSAVEWLVWLENGSFKDKADGFKAFEEKMDKRKEVTDKFKQKLTPQIQQHEKALDFFDLSLEEREARLPALLALQASMGIKEPKITAETANLDLSKDGAEQIKQRAEAVNDPDLEKMSDEDLKTIIEKGKNAQSLMEARTMNTILNELTEAANYNAKLNDNVKDAGSRTQGFSQEEKELAQQIAEESAKTGQKKILKRDRNNGEVKVTNVIKLDVKRTKYKSKEEIIALKRAATKIQRGGEQEKFRTNQVEMTTEGQTMSAEYGLQQEQKQIEDLQDQLTKNLADELKQKGVNVSDIGLARLKKAAKKTDLNVRLESDMEEKAA